MRRSVVLVLAAGALAGCNAKQLFTAHANTAAEAGSAELSADRLATLLLAGKGVKLDRATADFVANVWADYSLFAQAVGTGTVLTDSATIAEAMWPQLAELRGTHWHDTLLARRARVAPGAVDSAYGANTVRLLQHILVGVPQTATPEQRAQARRKAEAALARVRGGADFAKVAAEVSDDPGSKGNGGFLPPAPRGQFVPAFDSAGWALAPGAMTGLVETPFGYHIIRRPPLAQVREQFERYLKEGQAQQLDAAYMDSLAKGKRLAVSGEAPKLMKTAIEDPDAHFRSTATLASYAGGEVTVRDYLRWVRVLPPQITAQLKAAPDSSLKRFATILATNILLLRQADSAHIGISPEEWQGLRQEYLFQLDSLRADMGLGGSAPDASAKPAELAKAAQLKADLYIDEVAGGKRRLRPIPASLAMLLRERASRVAVHEAGLTYALELGRARRAKADSAKGPEPAAAPTGPVQVPLPPGTTPEQVQKALREQGGQVVTPPPAPTKK